MLELCPACWNPALDGNLPLLELCPGWNSAPVGTLPSWNFDPAGTLPRAEFQPGHACRGRVPARACMPGQSSSRGKVTTPSSRGIVPGQGRDLARDKFQPGHSSSRGIVPAEAEFQRSTIPARAEFQSGQGSYEGRVPSYKVHVLSNVLPTG